MVRAGPVGVRSNGLSKGSQVHIVEAAMRRKQGLARFDDKRGGHAQRRARTVDHAPVRAVPTPRTYSKIIQSLDQPHPIRFTLGTAAVAGDMITADHHLTIAADLANEVDPSHTGRVVPLKTIGGKSTMKLINKLGIIFVAALLCSGTAIGATKPIKITWWHAMGGDLGDEVSKLAAEFNHSQSQYKIVPSYKGTYAQTITDTIAAYRADQQPDIVQIYEVGTGTMLAAHGAIVPVYKLMHREGVAFASKNYIPAIRSYYSDKQGHLLSLPFNTSTPVLYYNKDEFKKAGLDPNKPPRTWQQLYKDAKKLKQAGVKCGFTTGWQSWIQLDNFAAWHNLPYANHEDGYSGLSTKLFINHKPFVHHIALLSKMAKEGLFQYGGRGDKATPLFDSGTCAMYTYTSGTIISITNDTKFKVGISMMPYDADIVNHPQNSLLGGATLWVMSGKPKSHYKGIAKFLAFLSKSKSQAEWSQKTGYVPVTKAAYKLNKKQGYYKKHPGTAVAIKELSLHKPTKNSKGIRLGSYVQIRQINNEELEAVWSGHKSAKQALNDAVRRGDRQLQKFKAGHS
jgi:sn-glycerol 3-phosphate transport system substrate-binding protein